MANKTKVAVIHKGKKTHHFESECCCLSEIGDEIVDPVAGRVIVLRKIWNDDPEDSYVTFITGPSPYPPI